MKIANRLVAARKAKGWTQAALAEKAGVSRSLVAHVENRLLPLTRESRLKLEKALGVVLRKRRTKVDNTPVTITQKYTMPKVEFNSPNKPTMTDKIFFTIFGAILLFLFVGLFASPYFEQQAFNRCTQGQATYWEAMFSNLQITNCK